ncbi:MalY/PatB family protein [Lentzea sp. NEAU-D7]|uniref:MalY/PatB family protein n=1 Tax=Lentzea sp. NEAU-D7 TaxID=2994667 RepID=UPI00224A5E4F|nr:aminotransferase class I/II-fold pyridoxal phosphate-dependent enzyme [Lentzea sp. NEAU-D7]MCX2949087.1 aminotransferase class I/II-fold pyridoxal phosphate-dependent enzyme [Lentzea sp. NEAU-D7]
MLNPLTQVPLERLRQRTSVKWRQFPDDVLPLWVAEMDVDVAEPVKQAVVEALDLGDTGYPAGTHYQEALAAFARERWGWNLPVDRTALVSDVMLGIVELIKLVSGPAAPVIVSPPVYPPFYLFVRSTGRAVVEAPLQHGRLDLELLERTFRHVKADRPVYLLCNPQNPTGTVHTAEELTALSRLAGTYGVRVIADEIHAPLVSRSTKFVPYLSVDENGMSLMSASKGWNLAAMRAAVAISNTDELARLPEEVSHGPSHFGTIAHTAALREGGEWLDALLAGLDDNRKLLKNLLSEHLPEIGYEPSEATFLAWLDCRAVSDDPAAFFVERGRVALMSGAEFGSGGAGHVRFNIGTSPEIITEAVRRMAASR